VLFEPIDNISMSSPSHHAQRIAWLELLWQPSRQNEQGWVAWKHALEQASVFGQLPTIHASLARCTRSAVAFGLKARLSRLLSDEGSVRALAQLMRVRGVRVVSLYRRNRIKQARAMFACFLAKSP
ncbi:MAG: hypothetical protein SGPRY_008734, partial [Prymnesium sp.]